MAAHPASPSSAAGEERRERLSLDQLQRIVGVDHVRAARLEDAIDGVIPHWVAEPASIEEAGGLLALAREVDAAVAPRGAGTMLGVGNPPARLDLILSMTRMNRVLEHAAGDLVARLEAGVRLEDAHAVFRQAGQWLPLDPPQPGATVGGAIAANAFGPHRLRYGTMRDLLIGMTYILPDGTVARAGGKVVKNVAGYDLCKLFTGSLGTLGIIAEAIVRLHPLPAASRTVTLRRQGSDYETLAAAAHAILHSSLVPGTILFRLTPRAHLLIALFEGVEPGVLAQAGAAADLLRPYGDVSVEADGWDATSERTPDWTLEWVEAIVELTISAPPADLGLVAAEVASAVGKGAEWYATCYAGIGITRVSLSGDAAMLISIVRRLRERVAGRGATVVITQAPPVVKAAIDSWGVGGDALPLMRRVKERFDPAGILNPGRFVGGI